MTLVRVGNVAQMPALATLMLCCSIAIRGTAPGIMKAGLG